MPSHADGREDRRVGEHEAARVEEIANGVDDFVPDPENGLLALGTHPEVAPIEQIIDAVLLRRDRKVVRGADDLQVLDVDLVAARRALVGASRAGDDHRSLLREMIGAREQLVSDRRLRHHGLDEAASVPQDEEMNLPARTPVVKPPLDGDFLALVPADVFDVGVHRALSSPPGTVPCARAPCALSAACLRATRGRRPPASSLHRSRPSESRQRRRPVNGPVERDQMLVGPAAIVVHVRRDRVLRDGLEGVRRRRRRCARDRSRDRCRRAGRRRPLRRSARASRAATARSGSLPARDGRRAAPPASEAPRRCAVRASRLLSPGAGCCVRGSPRCTTKATNGIRRAICSARSASASARARRLGVGARERQRRSPAVARQAFGDRRVHAVQARGRPRRATAAGRRRPPGCGSRSASAWRTPRPSRSRATRSPSRCSRLEPVGVVQVRGDPERRFMPVLPSRPHSTAALRRASASSS